MVAPALRLAFTLALAACVSSAAASYSGEGTYYGNNGWEGYCAGNMRAQGKQWPPNGGSFTGLRVALNSRQFPAGSIEPCGRMMMIRGSGGGSGGNPISKSWQPAMITNLCPECKYGDVDFGVSGDGRWNIEWYYTSGSGGNTIQSSGGKRANVPKKKKKAPAPLSARRKKARRSYLYQHSLAIKLAKMIKAAKKASVRAALRVKLALAKKRAASNRKIWLGRKLLELTTGATN